MMPSFSLHVLCQFSYFMIIIGFSRSCEIRRKINVNAISSLLTDKHRNIMFTNKNINIEWNLLK